MSSSENKNKLNKEYTIKKENKKKWKKEKLLKKTMKSQIEEVKKNSSPESKLKENDSPKEVSTLSFAIPGSVLDDQSLEDKAQLAGYIARAASIYNVDEIIVYDDISDSNNEENGQNNNSIRHSCLHMARICQYMECPQYLRKHFFPSHEDLKFVGKLPPLNAPHHFRVDEDFPFREGIIVNRPAEKGSFVNVGLAKDIMVDKILTPGLRVTVKIIPPKEGSKEMCGTLVAPRLAKLATGSNWGYSVRIANNLSSVFVQSPYSEGYDLTIGISDTETNIDELVHDKFPRCKHALIVFGGLTRLEGALENDPVLTERDPALLFDYFLNTHTNKAGTLKINEVALTTLEALTTNKDFRKSFIK